MKFKTTRRAVVERSARLVSAGYCDLQTLLRNHAPVAYTCGVYGWNFDVYEMYGLTIYTGYRNMPGATARGIREYESAARSIMDDPNRAWEEKNARVEELLREFCAQADGKGAQA